MSSNLKIQKKVAHISKDASFIRRLWLVLKNGLVPSVDNAHTLTLGANRRVRPSKEIRIEVSAPSIPSEVVEDRYMSLIDYFINVGQFCGILYSIAGLFIGFTAFEEFFQRAANKIIKVHYPLMSEEQKQDKETGETIIEKLRAGCSQEFIYDAHDNIEVLSQTLKDFKEQ